LAGKRRGELWLDPASGRDQVLGVLEKGWECSLAVSPDGGTILYAKAVGQGADLLLLEGSR
jgi:hypothetical protein